MSFEPTVTQSQKQQHKAWKEARERLRNAPLLAPKLVISNPVPVPPKIDPKQELMDFTIAAVANVAGLMPLEVLEGVPTTEVCNARDMAMGICVYRNKLPEDFVAEYFGIHPFSVKNAAKSVKTMIMEMSISSRTPLEMVLPGMWTRWVSDRRTVAIKEIQVSVCRKWNIPREDILSTRRTLKIVVPKQAAMALAKRLTHHSLPEIGRRFGGRDHTTILHAVRKFEPILAMADMPENAPLAAWVERIYELVQQNPFPKMLRKNKETA